jgi:hypothetical protein
MFKGMGKGELKRARLTLFPELGKTEMLWRIKMLGPEGFLSEVASKGSNVSNQAKVIEPEFLGEGESLGDNRGFGGFERLTTEWDMMGC